MTIGGTVEVRLRDGRSIGARHRRLDDPERRPAPSGASPRCRGRGVGRPRLSGCRTRLSHRAAATIHVVRRALLPRVCRRSCRGCRNRRTTGRRASDPPLRTVLCAEVPATAGDPLWAVRRRSSSPVRSVPNSFSRDFRTRPHRDARRAPNTRVSRLPTRVSNTNDERSTNISTGRANIAVVGRQALFAHDNTHHGLLMGRAVVDALGDDARLDRERWNAASRTFVDHVVED